MRIKWKDGYNFDRHIILVNPGNMTDYNRLCPLDNFIEVNEEKGKDSYDLKYWEVVANQSSIEKVKFTPKLRKPEDYGFKVNIDNGGVSYEEPKKTPKPKLRNFLIELEITFKQSTSLNSMIFTIRVNVHDTLERFWPTPNTLKVHRGTESERLRVLGKFEDETVGEITDWTCKDPHRKVANKLWWLNIKSSQNLFIGDMPGIANSGKIYCGKDFKDDEEAEFGVGVNSNFEDEDIPKCIVSSIEPWSSPTEVELVYGPGFDKRESVPNILFLPEGFEDSELTSFKIMVTELASTIKKKSSLSPFNHLVEYWNFWTASVPSPQAGISIHTEVYNIREKDNIVRALPVPIPVQPADSSKEWTLEQMIFKVGLPVKEDIEEYKEAKDKEKWLKKKIEDWQQLYDANISENNVKIKIFKEWLKLSDRTLINECDSAFGLSIGNRLSDQCHNLGNDTLFFDKKRIKGEDFNDFLSNLIYKAKNQVENKIGKLWIKNMLSPNLNNLNTVCFIARTNHFSGVHYLLVEDSPESAFYMTYIMLSLNPEKLFSAKKIDRKLNVFAEPTPENLKLTPWFTPVFVHELGHHFGLGDEYAGLYNERCRKINSGAFSIENCKGNVELREELINSVENSSTQKLLAQNINWRWPRIEKAAVLKKKPELKNSDLYEYAITVVKGHFCQWDGENEITFKKNDRVCLRARPLTRNTESNPTFIVTTDPVSDPTEGDVIQIAGDCIAPEDYPAGSILFAPRLETDKVLGLVSDAIIEHIQETGEPLNAPKGQEEIWDCQQSYDSAPEEHIESLGKATSLPDSLTKTNRSKPKFGEQIVGLYEGGMGFPCGIYHPSGRCIMLAQMYTKNGITPFCPVCRYLLVDKLDPTKHADIDSEYDKEYPK